MPNKAEILNKIWITALLSVGLFLSGLFIQTVQAADVITSMDELPSIEELNTSNLEDLKESVLTFNILKLIAQDQQDNELLEDSEEIVILYSEERKDQIGDLGLNREDFSAGESVTDQIDVLTTSGITDTDTLIEKISESEGVRAVSPNINLEPLSDPNDRYLANQYYLSRIGASSLWNQGGSNLVKVAVIDSGINWNHEDLTGQIDRGASADFSGTNFAAPLDSLGHGTGVAGVIAATANNKVGISGVVGKANVKIVNYRIAEPDGSIPLSNVVAALTQLAATDDIRIANLSLGTESDVSVFEEACKIAESKNKILVCGSGNTEINKLYYPAAYSSTIAVGAVDASNKRCSPSIWGAGGGSTYGQGLDLVAPGHKIATLDPDTSNNSYIYMSGTSFSSPMVSAAAAMLLSLRPDLSVSQVRSILTSTAQDLGKTGYDTEYGYGLLRVDKAIAALKNVSTETKPDDSNQESGSGSNNSGNNSPNKPSDDSNSNNDNLVSIYRIYNSSNGEHLYTVSYNEVTHLVQSGWTYEGIGWYAPASGKAVYRLYNANLQNHLYTTDTNEVQVLTSTQGWTVDFDGKPIFYSGGSVPIYRVYNRELRGLHHLTTDKNEFSTLPFYGWTQEGVSFYAQKIGEQ